MSRALLSGALAVLMFGAVGVTSAYAETVQSPEVAETSPVQALKSSNTVSQTTSVPDYQYKLTKVGTYKGDKSSLKFDDGSVVVESGDGYQIIGTDGQPILKGKVFSSYGYMGNGIYWVAVDNGEMNNTGLVSTDDEEILPCEVALIHWNTNRAEDARFLEIIYVTEETEDEDQAILFVSKGEKNLMYYAPKYGDTLYKGYARIFDLKTGEFVEDIQIDDAEATYNIEDYGQSFAIKQNNVTTLYDGQGKTLWSKEGSVSMYARYLVWGKSGKEQGIDPAGEGRYATSESLSSINPSTQWWSGDYLTEKSSSGYTVIDFDGKQILKGSYYNVTDYGNGLFKVREEDGGDYEIVALDGTKVLKAESLSFNCISPGYNTYYVDGDNVGIIKGADIIWKGESSSGKDCLIAEKNGKLLTLNDEKFSLAIDSVNGLDAGLARGRDEDSVAYGLYDLFTGKQLLTDDYDDIRVGADCIWAYANGSWSIYEYELQEK